MKYLKGRTFVMAVSSLILVAGLSLKCRAMAIEDTLSVSGSQLWAAAIDAPGGFAYFVSAPNEPGITKLIKVRLSDFSQVGELALPADEQAMGIAIDPAHDLGYISATGNFLSNTLSHPGTIIKVRLSDMTRLATRTFNDDQWMDRAVILDPAGEYGYFAYWTYFSPDSIGGYHWAVKVRLSDLSTVAATPMMFDDLLLDTVASDFRHGLVYYQSPEFGDLYKVDIQTMNSTIVYSPTPADFVDSGDVILSELAHASTALDLPRGNLYNALEFPASFIRVNIASFQTTGTLSLPFDPGSLVIDPLNAYAYIGDFDSNRIYRINIKTVALSQLNPSSAPVGSPDIVLRITGSGFVDGSVAYWNDSPLPTAYIDPLHLTADVSSSYFTDGGSRTVVVRNPAPDNAPSNALTFAILNPTPALTSIFVSSVTAGSPGLTIQVTGSGFVPGTKARWNGSERSTVQVSSTELWMSITADDLALPGSAFVDVYNPAPAGGASNALPFSILPAPPGAPQPPSLVRVSPNTVTEGDGPVTLTLEGSGFLPGASILWNGTVRPSNSLSVNSMTVIANVGDLSESGNISIEVRNPSGLISNPVILPILARPLQSQFTQDLASLKVFPNPWIRSQHSIQPVTFDGVSSQATVKIFTVSGRWVATRAPASGRVTWDLTNASGDMVASGLYLYVVTDPLGQKTIGKISVVK